MHARLCVCARAFARACVCVHARRCAQLHEQLARTEAQRQQLAQLDERTLAAHATLPIVITRPILSSCTHTHLSIYCLTIVDCGTRLPGLHCWLMGLAVRAELSRRESRLSEEAAAAQQLRHETEQLRFDLNRRVRVSALPWARIAHARVREPSHAKSCCLAGCTAG